MHIETHNGAAPTILVVEDHQTVRVLLATLLTANGYNVIVACNGRTGLQIWNEQRSTIAGVITDIEMPEMSGPAMAEAIWQVCSTVPVIYISGLPTHEIAASHVLKQNAFYLPKPFYPRALLTLLRLALD